VFPVTYLRWLYYDKKKVDVKPVDANLTANAAAIILTRDLAPTAREMVDLWDDMHGLAPQYVIDAINEKVEANVSDYACEAFGVICPHAEYCDRLGSVMKGITMSDRLAQIQATMGGAPAPEMFPALPETPAVVLDTPVPGFESTWHLLTPEQKAQLRGMPAAPAAPAPPAPVQVVPINPPEHVAALAAGEPPLPPPAEAAKPKRKRRTKAEMEAARAAEAAAKAPPVAPSVAPEQPTTQTLPPISEAYPYIVARIEKLEAFVAKFKGLVG